MAILPKDAPTQRELMLAKLKRDSDAEDLELGLQQAKMKREITKKELEAFKANQEELARQKALAEGPPPERQLEQLNMLSSVADNGSTGAVLQGAQNTAAARSLQDDPIAQLELLARGRTDVSTPDVYGRDFTNPRTSRGVDAEGAGEREALAEFARKRKLQQLIGGA